MTDQPPRLTHEFFYYIGLIVAHWTAIEVHLEFVILETQEIPTGAGLPLTSSLGTRAKMDLFETIINWKNDRADPKDTELTQIVADIKSAYAKRNNVAHHLWSPTTDPKVGRRRTIRARGRLKEVEELVSIDSLDSDAEFIHGVGQRLTDMHKAKRFHSEHSDDDPAQSV